jgi:hypothetical protein
VKLMTEAEWLRGRRVRAMLELLRKQGWPTDRKLRLFAVACCHRVRHLCKDRRGLRAAEVAERYAEGQATAEELHAAWEDAWCDDLPEDTPEQSSALAAVFAGRHACDPRRGWVHRAATSATDAVLYHVKASTGDEERAYDAQASESGALSDLLRDIVGNPLRPPPVIDAAWVAWHGGTVRRLAEAAYHQRSLPGGALDTARLGVLADALEEAGCTDADLLGHLRGPGAHVRGCWAVDLLWGRK